MVGVTMYKILIIISPVLINAKIAINLTIHSIDDVKVKYSGSDVKIITDKELDLFNITVERLNKGMKVELGKVPDSIFLKDPTAFCNTFARYKWEPVKRRLKVHNFKILDIIKEDVVLNTHEYVNNSTQNVKLKRSSHKSVQNTARSVWFVEGLPADEISYTIGLYFSYGYFKYDNKWRQDKVHASRMAINATEKGIVVIKPYPAIVTKLIATKTIVIIALEYKAELEGAAMANYETVYGMYHFWAPSIRDVMKAGKIKNEILTREQIEVKCYVNPRVVIHDKTTGEIVESKKRRPMMRILRNKNMNRILYTRFKKQEQKHDLKL